MGIAAAGPGTPSIRASPSYSTAPLGVGTWANAMLSVFTMWMSMDTTVSPKTSRASLAMLIGAVPAAARLPA